MILVTGAAGKTGQAIIRALQPVEEPVRAFVRDEAQREAMLSIGAAQVVAGDLRSFSDLLQAFDGVRAVYHICSNMNPDEVSIGKNAIQAARKTGLEHFVYHSVLHPQVQAMPHHWNKLQVEVSLFESGLAYTILQPAAYMQNVLGYWPQIMHDGIYAVPYSARSLFSLVDLTDVAEAAARVIQQSGRHKFAIYELCGQQILSNQDIARLLGEKIGQEVTAVALDRNEWEAGVRSHGMSEFSVKTLLNMFEYYDRYGFVGNGNVLAGLLGRSPTSFDEFLSRSMQAIPPSEVKES